MVVTHTELQSTSVTTLGTPAVLPISASQIVVVSQTFTGEGVSPFVSPSTSISGVAIATNSGPVVSIVIFVGSFVVIVNSVF
jgi:hypothetical protein